ncbi:phosphoribosylanthranilate isomerase [Candidatus Vidania fulgoroideae]|nr:phosphoribosylanthranilate isomerase [Candidatus Vidania fulgoroideae]
MKIKICGVSTIKEYLQCIKAQINYIGFNFYNKSKRYINYKKAKAIIKSNKSNISKTVGVFINPKITTLNKILSKVPLDLIQVNNDWHKHTTHIKTTPIIRCFNIKTPTPKIIKTINNTPQKLIIDSHAKHKKEPRKKFNWNILKKLNTCNMFIAGGININTLQYIINNFKPYGIDIASGSENKNKKCLKKITQLKNNHDYKI